MNKGRGVLLLIIALLLLPVPFYFAYQFSPMFFCFFVSLCLFRVLIRQVDDDMETGNSFKIAKILWLIEND